MPLWLEQLGGWMEVSAVRWGSREPAVHPGAREPSVHVGEQRSKSCRCWHPFRLGLSGWAETLLHPLPQPPWPQSWGWVLKPRDPASWLCPPAPRRPGRRRAQCQLRVGPQPASAAWFHGPQGLDRQVCVPADRLLRAHAPCPCGVARDGPSPLGPPADPQAGGGLRALGWGPWVGGKLGPQWGFGDMGWGSWGCPPEHPSVHE